MNLKSSKRSREWVKILPEVVAALNREETRLTGKNQRNGGLYKIINQLFKV